MIIGIGTDIIEVERISKICSREHFLKRCYTEKEIEYCKNNPQKFAGNFAVKEAVSKSFGTGISGFELTDIEVLRYENGKPYVVLYNGAKKKADELLIKNIHVSITNVKEYAQAFVVCEG